MDGPICKACGHIFWTTQRMQQHLRKTREKENGCFYQLYMTCLRSKEPVRWEIPAQWKHIQRLPHFYVEAQAEVGIDPAQTYGQRLQEWHDRWNLAGFPDAVPQELYDSFLEYFNCATAMWLLAPHDSDIIHIWCTHFDRLLQRHQVNAQTMEWCFYVWDCYDLPILLESTTLELRYEVQKDANDFLEALSIMPLLKELLQIPPPPTDPPVLPDKGPAAHGSHDRIDGQVLCWYPRQQELMAPYMHSTVDQVGPSLPVPFVVCPETGEKIFIIIHLFSGRRRTADCHDWLQAMTEEYIPGWTLWLLSFDTAIDPLVGDLNQGKNFQRVLQLARLGVVAAALNGPPCETYSAARHLPPPDTTQRRYWPRPLRHPLRPWGLDLLSMKELRQTHMGTRLMLSSTLLEAETCLGGGMSMMEHPAPRPLDGDKPSSWASPAQSRYMKKLPSSTMGYVEQWKYGALGVKPTTLRHVNMPGFAEIYREELPTAIRPREGLRGLDHSGAWRTSAAKEYPTALCKGMSRAVLASLRHHLRRDHVRAMPWDHMLELLPWIREVRQASLQIRAAPFLPDYQGR